jgi:hypothetical protein
MAQWTANELDSVGNAHELGLASRRSDGTLRPYVTMWVVRVGDELYVRSARGADNPWYRRAMAAGGGRIRSAGVEREVSFEQPADGVQPHVDAAYRAKYDRYGARFVGAVVGPPSYPVTIRLAPRPQPA